MLVLRGGGSGGNELLLSSPSSLVHGGSEGEAQARIVDGRCEEAQFLPAGLPFRQTHQT